MALPDVIPVRYSEEEAGYVSFRPIVRQSFRLNELLDMILSVTGKEPERIRTVLRSGTVVFHFYRYWWEGFEAGEADLGAALAHFPDADPSREFRGEACTLALVGAAPTGGGSGGASGNSPAGLVEIDRGRASRRRLLRRRSVWDALLAAARRGPLVYSGYSYAHHADLYRLELEADSRNVLVAAAQTLAPGSLQPEVRVLANSSHILFVCPRAGS